MPTHEPEVSEPYYSGDFYEGGHGNAPGAIIEYRYTEDDGYSFDPDAPGEVDWLSEPVASGPDVNWSDDAEKRVVGELILSHLLKRAPNSEELEAFMLDIAPSKLEDGMPFAIGVGVLRDAGLEA